MDSQDHSVGDAGALPDPEQDLLQGADVDVDGSRDRLVAAVLAQGVQHLGLSLCDLHYFARV